MYYNISVPSKRNKTAERELYTPIKEYLTEAFTEKFGNCYLETTANGVFSDLLKKVVRHERQFQMQTKALELLPSIQKLERLLGHRLNITEPIIKERVNDAVKTQLVELGLATLELDPTRVDWGRLILDACYREPPFKDSESEKGFRDSLIIESFLQLVEDSPKTPTICRVILVTGDDRLTDAVGARTGHATKVRILGSLEELKGMISMLAEEVREEFVETHKAKAKLYFFDETKKEGLLSKENILSRIGDMFKEVLESVPQGANRRSNVGWTIGTPRFVKKERQRVFWATRIGRSAEAYKTWLMPATQEYPHTTPPWWAAATRPVTEVGATTPSWLSGPPSTVGLPDVEHISPSSGDIRSIRVGNIVEHQSLVSRGKSVFEVVWSVIITTTGQFSSSKIERTDYVETTWE